MKTCTKCNCEKALIDFYRDKRGQFGVHSQCKKCSLVRQQKYQRENRQKFCDYQRKYHRGVTPEHYAAMLHEQRGVCAICKQPETSRSCGGDKIAALAVDHCHRTGRVRALLCQNCNRGLGRFHDDSDKLEAAARYIRERI